MKREPKGKLIELQAYTSAAVGKLKSFLTFTKYLAVPVYEQSIHL